MVQGREDGVAEGGFVRHSNSVCISISLESRACEKATSNARRRPGAFVPKCKADGTFEEKQCHSSTGYCWCVDARYGTELMGTKKGRGQGEVDCGMNKFMLNLGTYRFTSFFRLFACLLHKCSNLSEHV